MMHMGFSTNANPPTTTPLPQRRRPLKAVQLELTKSDVSLDAELANSFTRNSEIAQTNLCCLEQRLWPGADNGGHALG